MTEKILTHRHFDCSVQCLDDLITQRSYDLRYYDSNSIMIRVLQITSLNVLLFFEDMFNSLNKLVCPCSM